MGIIVAFFLLLSIPNVSAIEYNQIVRHQQLKNKDFPNSIIAVKKILKDSLKELKKPEASCLILTFLFLCAITVFILISVISSIIVLISELINRIIGVIIKIIDWFRNLINPTIVTMIIEKNLG